MPIWEAPRSAAEAAKAASTFTKALRGGTQSQPRGIDALFKPPTTGPWSRDKQVLCALLIGVTVVLVSARRRRRTGDGATRRPSGMPLNASGPWDFFISHVQRESGRAVALISRDLEIAGKRVWLDVNMDNCSEAAMMEGVDNSSNFVLVLSPGYCESSYCVAEVNRALQSGKNIILCHDEGVNVGAALKAKPPEFESIGSETSIQLVVSDPAFRKVAVDKILSQGRGSLSRESLSLGGPQSVKRMVVAEAQDPHRCMINSPHAASAQAEWDAGKSHTCHGWTQIHEFWAFSEDPLPSDREWSVCPLS